MLSNKWYVTLAGGFGIYGFKRYWHGKLGEITNGGFSRLKSGGLLQKLEVLAGMEMDKHIIVSRSKILLSVFHRVDPLLKSPFWFGKKRQK